MTIENISPFQFSLEGVVIEPGQKKELPDEQARRFVSLYAHTGRLKEFVQPKASVAVTKEEIKKAVPVEPIISQAVIDGIVSGPSSDDAVPPPLKVFKPRKKKEE